MTDPKEKVLGFIIETSKRGGKEGVDGDTPIFEQGYLDSLGFMQLILFLEELRGRSIPEEELDLASFATINKIVASYLSDG